MGAGTGRDDRARDFEGGSAGEISAGLDRAETLYALCRPPAGGIVRLRPAKADNDFRNTAFLPNARSACLAPVRPQP